MHSPNAFTRAVADHFFKNYSGGFKKNQHSIGFGLLYNFSTKS